MGYDVKKNLFQGEAKFLTGGDKRMLRVRELCASGQNGWEPHTNGIVRMKETKIQICIFLVLKFIFKAFFTFMS